MSTLSVATGRLSPLRRNQLHGDQADHQADQLSLPEVLNLLSPLQDWAEG
jgi:hypothetical protein